MAQHSIPSLALDAWRAVREGPAAIATRQQERLGRLVAFTRSNSAFYAEKYRDLPAGAVDLRQLPTVTKPELMASFDSWVTDPRIKRADLEAFVAEPSRIGELYLGRYLVCTTSGTTGVPAIIVQDPAALGVYGALNIIRSVPAWLTFGDFVRLVGSGIRTAAIWADHGHFLGISSARHQINQKPSRGKRMRIFSVLTPLPELVKELNAYQPAMLNGYSTIISLLADEQEAGRLRIHPALVITASESLPPGERERIKRVFQAPVGSQYGASEDIAIAVDCAHGWMHVNADWVILEPVDSENRPVPPGQPSDRVLLTNLANQVQPIIRYELGDRITVNPEPCPCGRHLPAIRLEGRTDDVLRFERSDGSVVPVVPLALWSVVKESPGVHRFQLIQTEARRLEVRLEAKHEGEEDLVWPTIQVALEKYLARQGLGEVAVTRSTEKPARDPRSGKFRHVWSAVKTGRGT